MEAMARPWERWSHARAVLALSLGLREPSQWGAWETLFLSVQRLPWEGGLCRDEAAVLWSETSINTS